MRMRSNQSSEAAKQAWAAQGGGPPRCGQAKRHEQRMLFRLCLRLVHDGPPGREEPGLSCMLCQPAVHAVLT